MNPDDVHLAVEVAQFLQHVHDIADLLAERMGSLPASEAEALLDQALIRLAVGAKQLEATSGTPEIASRLGYKVSAVIRTRVGELLERR
jgi:hypothetical protein